MLPESIALRFDKVRIEPSALQGKPLHALPCDVKGQPVAERIGEDRTARAQRVPHADFVPDIGIVQCQIGDDKLGEKQILEHVEVDRAAPAVGVRAVRHQPGRHDCRRKEVPVEGVKVDRGPVRRLLLAKRHDDERTASGCHRRVPCGP